MFRNVAWLLCLALAGCGGGDSGTPPPGAVAPPGALSYPSPLVLTVGVPVAPITPSITGVATSWQVTPALPMGLALDAGNGRITGTPAAASATATYVVTAANAAGSTSFALTITVQPAPRAALEPGPSTRLGVGQSMNVYFVQRVAGAPFPVYVDPALVTWSSSDPTSVTVSAGGVISAVGEGSATITAQYQADVAHTAVQVAGAWRTRALAVAGQGLRRYAVYTPPGTPAGGRWPALLALHGGGGTALLHAATTQLVSLAQEQRIVLVFPEGSGLIQTFNAGACCGSAQSQNVDDVAFANAVLDDVLARDAVDASRVYATGFSNGAMMSYRLACAMADRLAGIAAVGGASGQFDGAANAYYACTPARPVPVLHIHGVNDRNYPYAGGVGPDGMSGVNFYGVEATIADWLERNNVRTLSTVEAVTPTTSCRRHATPADPLRPSAAVTLCRVDPPDVYDAAGRVVYGGGHSWPGGVRGPGASSDVPVIDFSASAYLWAFFNP